MSHATQHSHIHPVNNPKRVEKIVVVGTEYECKKALGAIEKIRPKVELALVKTVDEHGSQLSEEHIKPSLARHLKNADEATLAISDIGEPPRRYPFEILAENIAELSTGAAFALLTDKQNCIGLHGIMEDFVAARNIREASILQKVTYTFHNSGDQTVFPTIIRLHEDHINHAHQPEKTILVAEDKPNYYTAFLNTLFSITQHRTRVLLARTAEQAEGIISSCKELLAGAILDVEFPQGGHLVKDAWQPLLNLIKKYDERAPVIVQSIEKGWLSEARKEPRVFPLWKGHPIFLKRLEEILNDYFGFGDFVFRMPDEREVARASNITELYYLIRTVDAQSVAYHASHNHFSHWLWLHNYKKLAGEFKPIQNENMDKLREMLLKLLHPYAMDAVQYELKFPPRPAS